jgi:GNAT superfamily N-acetyltransferase
MGEVTLSVADAGSEPARQAMTQYFAELAERFDGGFDAAGALDDASTSLNPPHGVFVVALSVGEPVGCAGLQFLDDATAEAKRMWVSPRARRTGLGSRLLRHLEDAALATGRRRMLLDTNATLVEAVALYEGHGYVAVPRYNDNPYAQHWFAKALG